MFITKSNQEIDSSYFYIFQNIFPKIKRASILLGSVYIQYSKIQNIYFYSLSSFYKSQYIIIIIKNYILQIIFLSSLTNLLFQVIQ
ncbi:hypothetical protein pb186bvf_020304 [Paramecium bursaria]